MIFQPTTREAFSLLELLIVLSIMVAIGAVAWPSLSRPIADSTVQQAAGLVREQLASARQEAAATGLPQMVRFDRGGSVLAIGSWKELVIEQLASDETVTLGDSLSSDDWLKGDSAEAASVAPSETSGCRVWQLPPEIVIEEVQFDVQSYAPETEQAEEGTGTRWYLALMPSGQSRDTVIVLRDVVSGSRTELAIDGVTGMMRTSRLAPLRDEASIDEAPEPPSTIDSESPTSWLSEDQVDQSVEE